VAEEQRTLNHEKWMSEALDLAAGALSRGVFPVGCVLISGDLIVGSGARLHTRPEDMNELDHAEVCALRDWIDRGRTLGHGDDTDITAYCNLEPCLMCLGALILNGIKRIVYAYEDVMGGATGLDFSRPLTGAAGTFGGFLNDNLYTESHIEILGGIKRRESLALFKRFFSDPAQSYWRNSLLYKYTLENCERSRNVEIRN
jgi:tRNA(adenine34) deaminase